MSKGSTVRIKAGATVGRCTQIRHGAMASLDSPVRVQKPYYAKVLSNAYGLVFWAGPAGHYNYCRTSETEAV